MEVGFNYPWPRNQTITIGPNMHELGKPHPWRADNSDLDRNLGELRAAGITVVRIWLLAHGTNYDGVVSRVRRLLVSDDWHFMPPTTVHPAFVDDFAALFRKFERAGMRMIPSLLDFAFFDEPEQWSKDIIRAGQGVETRFTYARGRRSVAEDPEARARFIEGTLKPLLAIAAQFRRLVHAFEIINEPWWCVSPATGSLFGKAVDKKAFISFLKDCVKIAEGSPYRLPSTIGHRYHSDLHGAFKDVRVTHPQFHYYAHRIGGDYLPSMAGSPGSGRKPFLGEFGAITKSELDALEKDPDHAGVRDQIEAMRLTESSWPFLDQAGRPQKANNVLSERLEWLASRGYELAVVWPNAILLDPTRDTLKLDHRRLDQVKDFMAAQRHGAVRR